jgi:hypothetical protein
MNVLMIYICCPGWTTELLIMDFRLKYLTSFTGQGEPTEAQMER